MAATERTQADALKLLDELRRVPYEFDFFQVMRLIECAYLNRPRIGESLHPADDPVRLAQEPSLNFPPATIAALVRGTNGRPPRLVQRAVGLFGPNGALPLHLTDYARERIYHHKDHTFARFADVFHHRMLSLFYRAWAQSEPTVQFDRPKTDRFANYVASLIGLGLPALKHRDAMPDVLKLHFAGRLSCPNKNAEGLEVILQSYFRIQTRLWQFAGDWLALPDDCKSRLGESPMTGTLGRSLVLGNRVWDCQHKFRIVMGPMGLELYQSLLPEGRNLPALVSIIKNYIGLDLSWDVRLILKKEEVPPIQLGKMGQLGRTTWLAAKSRSQDVEDYTLHSTSLAN